MRLAIITIAFVAFLGVSGATEDFVIRGSVATVIDGADVTWDTSNFAGFYYDIDRDVGNELLQLQITDQSVEPGAATYRSGVQEIAFEHQDWGRYRVLGFLGESYFAGYGDDSKIAPAWDSLGADNFLSEVLIDSNERLTVGSDEDLSLEDGYRIRFSDVKESVLVSLYKNNNLVDTTKIDPPETYIYATPMGDRNVTLIAVNVTGNVKLKPTSYYTTRGIFQISENPHQIGPGWKDGLMEITSIGDEELIMNNFQSLNLTPGNDFELMKGFRITVADQENEDTLRIYIYKNITEPGEYETRGPVAVILDGSHYVWGPQEFAGFYYDVDDDIGAEKISVTITDEEINEPWGVVYITEAQLKPFKFEDWGEYWTIGFLGYEYFAGYEDYGDLYYHSVDENLLVDEELSKVLVDSADPKAVKSGDIISLEEGYQVKIFVDNTCEEVFLELYKDGDLLEKDYFSVPHTYTYTVDLGDAEDIVVLALHIADVNCTGIRTCTVDGIFQISTQTLFVEEDTEYDKMTVQTVDPSDMTIEMSNEDNKISLSKNEDISLIGDIRIKTADSDDVPNRFYIYKSVTVEAT